MSVVPKAKFGVPVGICVSFHRAPTDTNSVVTLFMGHAYHEYLLLSAKKTSLRAARPPSQAFSSSNSGTVLVVVALVW